MFEGLFQPMHLLILLLLVFFVLPVFLVWRLVRRNRKG